MRIEFTVDLMADVDFKYFKVGANYGLEVFVRGGKNPFMAFLGKTDVSELGDTHIRAIKNKIQRLLPSEFKSCGIRLADPK